MDCYAEITVLPDPEFDTQQLLNAVFAKLHRVLGQLAQGKVGISFPDQGKRLGARIRLHGSREGLSAVMESTWLKGMRDYCSVSGICQVPENVTFRTVRRVQRKSAANLRKRSVTKGWLTDEDAAEKIPDHPGRMLPHPFIQMRSLSNGNPVKVFIEHGPEQAAPVTGTFSSYGLSAKATVPWF